MEIDSQSQCTKCLNHGFCSHEYINNLLNKRGWLDIELMYCVYFFELKEFVIMRDDIKQYLSKLTKGSVVILAKLIYRDTYVFGCSSCIQLFEMGGSPIEFNYCPKCGQEVLNRISAQSVFDKV